MTKAVAKNLSRAPLFNVFYFSDYIFLKPLGPGPNDVIKKKKKKLVVFRNNPTSQFAALKPKQRDI